MLKIVTKNTLIAICDRCKEESNIIAFDNEKPIAYAFDNSNFSFSYNLSSERGKDGYCNCEKCKNLLLKFSDKISNLRKVFDKIYFTDAIWGGLCHFQKFYVGNNESPIEELLLNLVSKDKNLLAVKEGGWLKITHNL